MDNMEGGFTILAVAPCVPETGISYITVNEEGWTRPKGRHIQCQSVKVLTPEDLVQQIQLRARKLNPRQTVCTLPDPLGIPASLHSPQNEKGFPLDSDTMSGLGAGGAGSSIIAYDLLALATYSSIEVAMLYEKTQMEPTSEEPGPDALRNDFNRNPQLAALAACLWVAKCTHAAGRIP